MGSCSVVQCVRRWKGHPLYCSAADAGVWGERGYGDGSTLYMWLSRVALLPRLPGFPPPAFSTRMSSRISSWSVSPQSTAALALGSLHNPQTSAPSCCPFQGASIPVLVIYGCGKDSLILIPFRLPQISCFTLSLKCFSSDSDYCPDVGIRLLLQFPHPQRAGPVLLTLLFSPLVPSSYQVLRGSVCSFPLVRYSCPLSAGVLQTLLCLKVYSWCIRGERCTSHPLTPPPSSFFFFNLIFVWVGILHHAKMVLSVNQIGGIISNIQENSIFLSSLAFRFQCNGIEVWPFILLPKELWFCVQLFPGKDYFCLGLEDIFRCIQEKIWNISWVLDRWIILFISWLHKNVIKLNMM